jgi:uncharacterized membrane protein
MVTNNTLLHYNTGAITHFLKREELASVLVSRRVQPIHELCLRLGVLEIIWMMKKAVYFQNSHKHETFLKQQGNSLSFAGIDYNQPQVAP